MDKSLITIYIESKRGAWSPSTLRSEEYRLQSIWHALKRAEFAPKRFYEEMVVHHKPYTLRTVFMRTILFMEFAGNNTFRRFFEDNARLFKYCYKTKYVKVEFDEAKKLIREKIKDEAVRRVATLMITTGMRIHEAIKYDGSGEVLGKGGRTRPIFSDLRGAPGLSEAKVRRALNKVSLNPHDLRKLAATKLVEAGFKEADLLYTMGWASMQTAARYLQPQKNEILANKVMGALGNGI